MGTQSAATTATTSRANIALALATAGVVLFIIAMILPEGDYEWLWPVAGLVGGAGSVMGWIAGRPRPQGRALTAVVLGGLVLLIILGWMIGAAATGNF